MRRKRANRAAKGRRNTTAPSGALPKVYQAPAPYDYSRYATKQYRPKPRSGSNYKPIVIVNPSNPAQARHAVVGKRGGIHPQSHWGDTKKIVAAIPGAALLTAGAGMAFSYIKTSDSGRALAKKLPGGSNTLALGVGAALGYIGYKYRALMAFLAGLGLAAYALVKLGTKEANLLEASDEDGSPDEGGATSEANPSPAPAPSSTSPAPETQPKGSTLGDGLAAYRQGKVLLKSGDALGAIAKFNEAFRLSGGQQILNFYLGSAYEMLADGLYQKSKYQDALTNYQTSKACLQAFIANAVPTEDINQDDLDGAKSTAGASISRLDSMIDELKKRLGKKDPLPVAGDVVSGTVMAGEEEGEEYDMVEGDDEDDDGYDVEGDDGYEDDDDGE